LLGTQWSLDYNNVWGNTDVFNSQGGNIVYTSDRAGRQSNAITYTSPDLNGFSFGLSAIADSNGHSVSSAVTESVMTTVTLTAAVDAVLDPNDNSQTLTAAVPAVTTMFVQVSTVTSANRIATLVDPDELVEFAEAIEDAESDGGDDNALDKLVFAASYSRGGFDVGGTYVRRAITSYRIEQYTETVNDGLDRNNDGTADDDTGLIIFNLGETNPTTYGVSFGYGQDNWSLDYWYGRTDHDSSNNKEDKLHSLAGQLGVGKTTLRALWELKTEEVTGRMDADSEYFTFGVQYDLGSRARVFAEYESEEEDSVSSANVKTTKDTDIFVVGYRVDF